MNQITSCMQCNFHTHTTFCDGSDSAEDVVRQAIAFGMKRLGFSGHMDPEIHMDWPAYTAGIRRLQEKYRGSIDIFLGSELDIWYPEWVRTAPPAENYLKEIYRDAEYLIGSVHYLRSSDGVLTAIDDREDKIRFLLDTTFAGDPYAMARAYFALVTKVYDMLHCTFIGHFDLITRFNDSMHYIDESDPRYTGPALEAMEYLVREGVPFELNCGAVNRGRKKELYPDQFLLRKLHDFGGEILITADAHQKEKLHAGFDIAMQRAAAAGFDHVNVLSRNEPAEDAAPGAAFTGLSWESIGI